MTVVLLFYAFLAQATFSTIPPPPADSLRLTRELPAVDILDTEGRTWRAEDFLGKYTLVYVWQTFEARSVDAHAGRGQDVLARRAGLPDLAEVQRFYERAKGTDKLQVLTFCSDYDYTHAPEYMKQAGYRFPVVADWKLVETLFGPEARNVRYWVIGPDGRVAAPFRSWTLGRVLHELESASR